LGPSLRKRVSHILCISKTRVIVVLLRVERLKIEAMQVTSTILIQVSLISIYSLFDKYYRTSNDFSWLFGALKFEGKGGMVFAAKR
jgi:hypothetical protein